MDRKSLVQNYLRTKNLTVTDVVTGMGLGSRNTFYYNLKKETLDEKFIQSFNVFTGGDLVHILSTGEPSGSNRIESNATYLGSYDFPLDPQEDQFKEIGPGQYMMMIPKIDEYAYAGYLAGYKDKEFIEDLPRHIVIVTRRHNGNYIALVVRGDSMFDGTSDSIPDGSIATGREIQRQHWVSKFHLHKYRDYIIVHKTDGIIVKRLIDHDTKNGVITCHSLNPDKDKYPDLKLHLDDLEQIFNVVTVSTERKIM